MRTKKLVFPTAVLVALSALALPAGDHDPTRRRRT
jgi:hypothetical protein